MWALYAFIAAILHSGARLTNQYLKLSGIKLTLATKCFQIVYVFPLLIFVEWPDSFVFYLMAAATAPLVVYHDKSLFDFKAKYEAGAVSRIEPLSVPLVFLLWFLVEPSSFTQNLENPIRFLGIVICILALAFFAIRLKDCPVNFETLKAMIPLIFIMAVISILAKIGIDHSHGYKSIAAYIFIQSLLVIIISWFFDRRKSTNQLYQLQNKNAVKTAFFLSLLGLGVIFLRLLGFFIAPNPAYVTAIMLTGPFWIMIFYRIVKHEEKGDLKSGIAIVLTAIILTLIVSNA